MNTQTNTPSTALEQVAETIEQVEASQGVSFENLIKSSLGEGVRLSAGDDKITKRLKTAAHVLNKSGYLTLKPLLPLLLEIRGKPYHLHDHFPFAPFFRTRMPRRTLLKTGRQVSKSTSLAAQGVLFSNCIPYFSTLYITPLFEMIRRFSQNYVRPFIETSPVVDLFMGSTTINSVLQRSFKNRSQMLFSFAYQDAERTRGISADKNVIDEVQDMDISFLPIIHETISASQDWGLIQYAGTPKTMDNTIEVLWQDSSMAEWMIKCPHCAHWNIPALEYDLVAMIGPYHSDISETCPGIVCAKCRKPVNPRPAYQGGTGRWVHRMKDRRWTSAGYHIPQIIMPMHYADPEKWEILVGKQQGKGNTPVNVFMNEVCGESYDSGSKLVTVTDLRKAACLPWKRDVDEAKAHVNEYNYKVVSVDWGGGGVKAGKSVMEYQSYTAIAVLGMGPGGKIDVLYGYRSLHPHDHVREARMILGVMNHFQCSHLVHDYTGAGAIRETVMNHAGLPLSNIVPIAYTGPAKGNVLQFKPATALHPRDHFNMEKARSLSYTCQFIKSGVLRFFEYDYISSGEAGLIHDFLYLVEDKSETGFGRDRYQILRDPAGPDDFAQAVNMGTMMLCHMSGQWPNLADYEDVSMGADAREAVMPITVNDWEDM